MSFNPEETYVHLGADGVATEVPGAERFWSLPASEMARFGRGWLVSGYRFDADWPTWEMHPNADEFVYLLSGSVDLHLEEAEETRRVALRGSGAVVVPRGVWHTAKVHAPSHMLIVTLGEGTAVRPV